MFTRLMSYAWLMLFLVVVVASPDARAAQYAFDVLRQFGDWEARFIFLPATGDRGDYSLKLYDSAGVLQSEVGFNYGYSKGVMKFPSFEAMKSSVFTAEYKPSGTTDVSVYRVALSAAGWSSSDLPESYPFVGGQTFTTGQSVTITWPVRPSGSGRPYVDVRARQSPFASLYHKSVDYTLGTLVTDGLPNGSGSVEVDFSRIITGATTQLDLLSGPATDLVATPDVTFYSWQSSGFSVVPEVGSVSGLGAMGVMALLRRRACVGR